MKKEKERGREQKQSGPVGTGQVSGLRAFRPTCCLVLGANAGNVDLVPGLGRSPGEGNDNSLQYSCLENPRDRGAHQATVHRVAESDRT